MMQFAVSATLQRWSTLLTASRFTAARAEPGARAAREQRPRVSEAPWDSSGGTAALRAWASRCWTRARTRLISCPRRRRSFRRTRTRRSRCVTRHAGAAFRAGRASRTQPPHPPRRRWRVPEPARRSLLPSSSWRETSTRIRLGLTASPSPAVPQPRDEEVAAPEQPAPLFVPTQRRRREGVLVRGPDAHRGAPGVPAAVSRARQSVQRGADRLLQPHARRARHAPVQNLAGAVRQDVHRERVHRVGDDAAGGARSVRRAVHRERVAVPRRVLTGELLAHRRALLLAHFKARERRLPPGRQEESRGRGGHLRQSRREPQRRRLRKRRRELGAGLAQRDRPRKKRGVRRRDVRASRGARRGFEMARKRRVGFRARSQEGHPETAARA